tara:strand:- start:209 stop:418 length:210 start_codon:yes stop_codon:yes gene_type:complete
MDKSHKNNPYEGKNIIKYYDEKNKRMLKELEALENIQYNTEVSKKCLILRGNLDVALEELNKLRKLLNR